MSFSFILQSELLHLGWHKPESEPGAVLWGCLLPGRLTAAPAEGGGHWDVHTTICQVTSVDDSRELETETQDSNMSGDSEQCRTLHSRPGSSPTRCHDTSPSPPRWGHQPVSPRAPKCRAFKRPPGTEDQVLEGHTGVTGPHQGPLPSSERIKAKAHFQ